MALSSMGTFAMRPTYCVKSPTRSKIARAIVPVSAAAVLAATTVLLSACNPGKAALDTNVPLKPAPDLKGAATPGVRIWRSPDLAQHLASAYIIPPVTVYHGEGASFADLTPQEVDGIAAGLTKEVRAEVGRHFKVVNTPGPGVATIELILVRVDPPRFEYVGSGPYEISELAVGMPNAGGMTAGSLTISGKFIDSDTAKLRVAFIAPVSPQVMDLPAPGNPARALDFAQAGSEQFAADLVHAMLRETRLSQMPQK
jgi:hypothetical protein